MKIDLEQAYYHWIAKLWTSWVEWDLEMGGKKQIKECISSTPPSYVLLNGSHTSFKGIERALDKDTTVPFTIDEAMQNWQSGTLFLKDKAIWLLGGF